jgi:hypothetical protein
VIRFAKGDNREEIARPYLEAAAAAGGKGKVALMSVAVRKSSYMARLRSSLVAS